MNRRRLLKATAGFAVTGLAASLLPGAAQHAGAAPFGISASEFGVLPGAPGDQARAFSAMLEEASRRDAPVFLPPGHYVLSRLILPERVRLSGVAGATRLIHGGSGGFITGRELQMLSLTGLVIDGVGTPLPGDTRGLVDIRGVGRVGIDDCTIVNAGGSALALEQAAGRIANSRISNIAAYGLYALDGRGLDISGNYVADCGDGGILVHRSAPGRDASRIAGNRIERIRADSGGTGQYGNAINAFRANDVQVVNNHITDSAFSAVRGNGAGNFQILGNHCLRSGETALYAEFAFEGAVIANNVVDGAAQGISMANFDHGGRLCTCTGNIIRNMSLDAPYPTPLTGFGIGISVEADAAVTGNLIESAPLHGIRIGWGPFLRNVSATGNVIRKAGTGIAVSVVEDSGAAVVSSNVISETDRGAVVGYRWADAVTGDLTREGSDAFAHLTVAGNQAG